MTVYISLIGFIVYSYVQYLQLEKKFKNKNNQDIVYGHEFNSLKDQYLNILIISIFVLAIYYLHGQRIVADEPMIARITCLSLLILITMLFQVCVSYNISEIKHISKQDYIGKNIDSEGKKHYINVFTLGIIGYLFSIYLQTVLFNMSIIVIANILLIVLWLGIMADVFQKHNEYNKSGFVFKNLWNTLYFSCRHIIEVVFNKDHRKMRMDVCKENLRNIYLGLKELY